MLEGGSGAANVMPGDVQATINFRMLPGTTAEDVLDHIRKALGELDVEVEALHTTPAGRMDKTDKAGYQELKEVLEHYYPKVEFVPSFVCGEPTLFAMNPYVTPFCVSARFVPPRKTRPPAFMALMSALPSVYTCKESECLSIL